LNNTKTSDAFAPEAAPDRCSKHLNGASITTNLNTRLVAMAYQAYSIVRLHKTFLFTLVTFFHLLLSGRIFFAWRNKPLALNSSLLLAGYGPELWVGGFLGCKQGVKKG
jgi:hypothetical protein